jgi:hypothetical protein
MLPPVVAGFGVCTPVTPMSEVGNEKDAIRASFSLSRSGLVPSAYKAVGKSALRRTGS